MFSVEAELISSIVTKIQIVRVTSKLLQDVKESNNMAEYKANNNNKTYAQQVKLSSSADDNEMRSQVRVPILLPSNHKNQGVYGETPSIYGEHGSQDPSPWK